MNGVAICKLEICSFERFNSLDTLENDVQSQNANDNNDMREFDPKRKSLFNVRKALKLSLTGEYVPPEMQDDLKELKNFLLNDLNPNEYEHYQYDGHNAGEYLYDLFEYLLSRGIVKNERRKIC